MINIKASDITPSIARFTDEEVEQKILEHKDTGFYFFNLSTGQVENLRQNGFKVEWCDLFKEYKVSWD